MILTLIILVHLTLLSSFPERRICQHFVHHGKAVGILFVVKKLLGEEGCGAEGKRREPELGFLGVLVADILTAAKPLVVATSRNKEIVRPRQRKCLVALLGIQKRMPDLNTVKPDFRKAFTVKTIVSAIGQAFFSLSIGLGCLITFSSYFKKGTNLSTTAWSSSMLTFLVGVLAGMIIFPAVFSVKGLEPTQGPTLLFETLPFVFKGMSMPQLWYAIFFLLIALAALTSTITFHEVITQYFQDYAHLSRRVGATMASGISVIVSIICLKWQEMFDLFDSISANVLMPIGGLLTAVFAGWVFSRSAFRNEISNGGTLRAPLFGVLRFLLRWISPLLIGGPLLYNIILS